MRSIRVAAFAVPLLAALVGPLSVRGSTGSPSSEDGSRSIGFSFRGRLVGAAELDETDHIAFKYGSPERERYGTDELVRALERASGRVAATEGGAPLLVGDLSLASGGRMRPHLSHRSGRDVDIAFYMLDDEGRSATREAHDRFARVRRDGSAKAGALRFDTRRNWRLLETMLTDDEAAVSLVLVARHLQAKLLEEARVSGARADVVRRAREVMLEPRRGGKHDDHFHVRIGCPEDDKPECRERRPAPSQLAPLR